MCEHVPDCQVKIRSVILILVLDFTFFSIVPKTDACICLKFFIVLFHGILGTEGQREEFVRSVILFLVSRLGKAGEDQ